jgi:hypothetical protein
MEKPTMINIKGVNILGYVATFSLIVILTACNSNSSNDDPVIPVFNPSIAPQNVQVVSGDGDSSAVQNTISWTRDPADPDYVVYVDMTSGVDETSNVVISDASGYNYVTHSGADVVAGTTYYYRVQAVSGNASSILSAEVTGTPQQSITNNALNDVAWNGTALVAVGDSGVILNSPNGMTDPWIDVSGSTKNALTGVTWDGVNSQFLIVGAGSTVLTGDGSTWGS